MTDMTRQEQCAIRPARAVESMAAYAVPRPFAGRSIDLWLDANECPQPGIVLAEVAATAADDAVRRYPARAELEAMIARQLAVGAEQVLVTAGGDDALDRCCRAMLEPGRTIVLPTPTFEMIERSANIAGAEVREVPWRDGAYPVEQVAGRIDESTGIVAVVSPNNPTGAAASAEDLWRLSDAAGRVGALVMADLAYEEFADMPLTAAALALPNAVIVRTFSKAFGLAGMRVGYAVGPAEAIGWLRAVGSPYPASAVSLAAAARCLDVGVSVDMIEQVRSERRALREFLGERGVPAPPSQANFVLGRFNDAPAVQRRLAERGIAVRAYPGIPRLERCLRITCPGCARAFSRLCAALGEIL